MIEREVYICEHKMRPGAEKQKAGRYGSYGGINGDTAGAGGFFSCTKMSHVLPGVVQCNITTTHNSLEE